MNFVWFWIWNSCLSAHLPMLSFFCIVFISCLLNCSSPYRFSICCLCLLLPASSTRNTTAIMWVFCWRNKKTAHPGVTRSGIDCFFSHLGNSGGSLHCLLMYLSWDREVHQLSDEMVVYAAISLHAIFLIIFQSKFSFAHRTGSCTLTSWTASVPILKSFKF